MAEHDALIWAVGRTSFGISEKDYTSLTYEYPMAALRALSDAGAGKDRPADAPFRIMYVSSELADPMQKSWRMWARVKVSMAPGSYL